MIDIERKKQLIQRIEKNFENEAELRQLLNIFIKYKVKFTENFQGCFIDLAKVNNKKLYAELEEKITSYEQNKKYLESSTKAYNDAINKTNG